MFLLNQMDFVPFFGTFSPQGDARKLFCLNWSWLGLKLYDCYSQKCASLNIDSKTAGSLLRINRA